MNLTQAISFFLILIALNFVFSGIIQCRAETSSINTQHAIAIKKSKKKFSTTEKNFMAGIALFPLLMGLWAINYWFGEYNKARETTTWKAVQGTLLHKGIEAQQFDSTHESFRSTRPVTHVPTVEYSFEYNGKTYIGTTLGYLNQPAYGNKERVQAILDKLPETGEKVIVYVSPNASRAVLFRGTRNMSYFGILAGIPFFLAGLIGIKVIYGF